MGDIKLTGKFQPNVYMDFLQGKIFGNRWAAGYSPFDTKGWKNTQDAAPLYVYYEDKNTGESKFVNTGIECPSTLMCIDPNKDTSIKVDIFQGVELDTYGSVIRLEKYTSRLDYLESLGKDKTEAEWEEYNRLFSEIYSVYIDADTGEETPIYPNAVIDYFNKPPQSVDDDLLNAQYWEESVVIRPQAVCMPMLRPIVFNGVSYGNVESVNEGDTFTITVLPNRFSYILTDPISNTVLLFSDKRFLMAESYLQDIQGQVYIGNRFNPDENIDYTVDNIDNYYGKFKINGEYVGLILLDTGTSITLKAESSIEIINGKEEEIVYWNVENSHAFQECTSLNLDLTFQTDTLGPELSEAFDKQKVYCSNTLGKLADTWLDIYINTEHNCFENSFYMRHNWYNQ